METRKEKLEAFLGREATEADWWLVRNGWKHELSGGGCMWAIKSVGVGGLWMALTDEDGCSTPVRLGEKVQVGLYDYLGNDLCDMEWESLMEMELDEDRLRWSMMKGGE